jgi:hypothetical protein
VKGSERMKEGQKDDIDQLLEYYNIERTNKKGIWIKEKSNKLIPLKTKRIKKMIKKFLE